MNIQLTQTGALIDGIPFTLSEDTLISEGHDSIHPRHPAWRALLEAEYGESLAEATRNPELTPTLAERIGNWLTEKRPHAAAGGTTKLRAEVNKGSGPRHWLDQWCIAEYQDRCAYDRSIQSGE